VKFERITVNERQQLAVKSKEVGTFRNQRADWESPVHRTAPGAPATAQHEPHPETKTAPAPANRPPSVEPPPKTPPRQVNVAEHTPAPPVRVTHPEREIISNPPIVPKPAESRYIEKASPVHPAPESYRPGASANPRSPAQQGKNQKDEHGRDK
jgi:hypothetical protein